LKVVNIHTRIITQPAEKIAELLDTLATREDKIWPQEHWPPMRFNGGLRLGARGGHGPIRYTVEELKPGKLVKFRFFAPKGFNGYHLLEVNPVDDQKTELRHVLKMTTGGFAMLSWPIVYRWLHDALVEDALDKAENHFIETPKKPNWNFWVRFLRKILS